MTYSGRSEGPLGLDRMMREIVWDEELKKYVPNKDTRASLRCWLGLKLRTALAEAARRGADSVRQPDGYTSEPSGTPGGGVEVTGLGDGVPPE